MIFTPNTLIIMPYKIFKFQQKCFYKEILEFQKIFLSIFMHII